MRDNRTPTDVCGEASLSVDLIDTTTTGLKWSVSLPRRKLCFLSFVAPKLINDYFTGFIMTGLISL